MTNENVFRATFLLVPLLGLHYLVTVFRPPKGHPWERAYDVTSAITASFQVSAFCVQLFDKIRNGLPDRLEDPSVALQKSVVHAVDLSMCTLSIVGLQFFVFLVLKGLCVAIFFCFCNGEVREYASLLLYTSVSVAACIQGVFQIYLRWITYIIRHAVNMSLPV